MLKERLVVTEGKDGEELSTDSFTYDDDVEDLQTELKVWKEKYNYLKESIENPESMPQSNEESSELILDLQNRTIELEAEVRKHKSRYTDAIVLAEKAINELKKRTK
jgi:predicted  nucleic acid-binding Zn-ribbon protein